MSAFSTTEHLQALPSGYQLHEYTITGMLGHGGFGITYAARDNNLDTIVAIKEYLPSDKAVRLDGCTVSAKSARDKADFEWGLKRFLAEAKTLAMFDHPHIVKIFRFFEDNGTGYMVMEFVKGRTLAKILKQVGSLPEHKIQQWLWPIMRGLETVHAAGYLHRDIKPQNIMIREDGRPVLLDFGAARVAAGDRSVALTAIMTPGFAPLEQYQTSGDQGPWTDIYALGAVLHCCITGRKPLDVMDRVTDDSVQKNLRAYANHYSKALLQGTSAALSMSVANRPRELSAWRRILEGRMEADTVELPVPDIDVPPEQRTRIQPVLLAPSAVAHKPAVEKRQSRFPKSVAAVVILAVVLGIPAWFQLSESESHTLTSSETLEQNAEAPHPEIKTQIVAVQPTTEMKQQKQVVTTETAEPEPEPEPEPPISHEEQSVAHHVDQRSVEPVSAMEQSEQEPVELASEMKLPLPAAPTKIVAPPVKPVPTFALNVQTRPGDAEVRILNIQPKYQPGMALSPGSYHIEVSREGFVTQRFWESVERKDTEILVSLDPSTFPLVVDTVPQDAAIRILNAGFDYKPGVLLPPGNYHVEVSKAGFVTEHERVLIVDQAQFPSISLTPVPQEPAEEPVELSVAAKLCRLPQQPPGIGENADYNELLSAKNHISRFQNELLEYRSCLDASGLLPEQTNGNLIALNRAHNDSVDMEEQVATDFNQALRAYKNRSGQALAKQ